VVVGAATQNLAENLGCGRASNFYAQQQLLL